MNALIRSQRNVLSINYGSYTGKTCTYAKYSSRAYRSRRIKTDKISSPYCLERPILHTQIHPVVTSDITNLLGSLYNGTSLDHHNTCFRQRRHIHLSGRLWDQPSSKVEVTVQTIKNKQKEEEIKKDSKKEFQQILSTEIKVSDPHGDSQKKPLRIRIWEEIVHYYHGFRLLFIDINICRKLLWRVLQGKKLTRRESRLLVRTTSDLFRLLPFSIFIIVPFMEFLLPVFIKLFPGMLPSTFQTAKEREDKLKQSLQVKLEVAKFLQKTLDEMAVQHTDHKSKDAKEFSKFFKKIKDPNEEVSCEEIIKFAKHFEDELTLDSLSRDQLVALCRVLEVNTIGTSNFLRFQLRMKLRNLAADDKLIQREGISSLNLYELQQACRTRGMRAYGLSEDNLRRQLQEWIDLSLNEKVPPTLLLLSRALMVPDEVSTKEKLKASISSLPDSLATQTKAAIGEKEGKIDNKTKIEIIKEEERKIREEREEEKEEEKEVKVAEKARAFNPAGVRPVGEKKEEVISPKDVEVLEEALETLSKDKKQLLVEKETIKDLKEEIEEYKEDVEELHEITTTDAKQPIKETRAAKILFKKVNAMIDNLDKVLTDLEEKEKKLREDIKVTSDQQAEVYAQKRDQLVRIDELVAAIKQMRKVSDESRLKTIEKVLSKIDADKDGHLKVDDVMKVLETIGRENVNLSEKQVEELIELLDKEEVLEAEDKIERALAKGIKESKQIETPDKAPILQDKAPELSCNVRVKHEKLISDEVSKEAVERQVDKILPKTPPAMPSPLPPPIPSATKPNSKDKML